MPSLPCLPLPAPPPSDPRQTNGKASKDIYPPYPQTKRPTPPNPFPIFQLSKHLPEEEEKKGSGSYCGKKKIKLKRRRKRWQRDTLGTVREYKRLTVKIWGIQMKKMKTIRREESEDKPTI